MENEILILMFSLEGLLFQYSIIDISFNWSKESKERCGDKIPRSGRLAVRW